MTDYKPGQVVWLSAGGNYRRIYRSVPMPIRATVVSIKRKYFYVKPDSSRDEIKFDKETGASVLEDCNSSWTIWETEQAYHDAIEKDRKITAVERAMRDYRTENLLSLDQVRELYHILDEAGAIREEDRVCRSGNA